MGLNQNVFTVVVLFLGVALLSCIGGIIYLSANGTPTPDILQNISSGVVAGLIGLLVQRDTA